LKISWKLFLSVIFPTGLLFMATALEADAGRGVRLQIRASEQKNAPIVAEVQLYGSSYALVIGIDNYSRGWPRLSYAIRDAELVAEELRKKGFEVALKKNLDSDDLELALREFFVLKGDDPQARLFVWFAGHGYTQSGEGYLIPADTPSPEAGAGFRLKALSMRRFGEYVRQARAKHALAVFDSCFSGTIFTSQRSKPPAAVTRATTFPVRQFLSSGDENQEVSDDGRFRKLFIRALRGETRADANSDGYLTGSELGMFLTDQVTNLTEEQQTPRYGKLRDEDYNRGDFVFSVASSGAVVETPPKPDARAILSVESNVTGARVFVDDRLVGSTNLADTEIPGGEHRIRVEKEGYESYSREVRFARGGTVTLYVDLRPKEPSKARLFVDTEPEAATIRILNIKPRFVQGMALEPGRYRVEVSARGHQTISKWIELDDGEERYLSFKLEKISILYPSGPDKIVIGINAPISGDIPKVGEATRFAAQMWLKDINAAGGIEVGGKKYKVELVIEDNEARPESAVRANHKLIAEDGVLAIVGPQSSRQAVPAGETANKLGTPMISPWSTNPNTTRDRPFVFRGGFLDPIQGPVVAKFAIEEFGFTRAAVLYDSAGDYPRGLAEFFKAAWEDLNGPGSVVAYESFTTRDTDFSSQLVKIIASGAEFLFAPQYYDEVALIVQQAHQLGWDKPILGSDSWGSSATVELCGKDCYGLFFSTHYAAAGAKGAAKEFIDRYRAAHGYVPDDVAALTWDAMRIVQKAIEGAGELTGDIKKDRRSVRNALASIKDFDGITGGMTFTEEGDPIKCAVIVRISNAGEFEFYKSVCP